MSKRTFAEQVKHLTRRDQVFDFMIQDQPPVFENDYKPILFLEDISVSFDGFKAINNLNLYVYAGELRCIIGPNGAGKSTMMDIITGKTKPDSGRAWFKQSINLLKHNEAEIAQYGFGRKLQKPTVFENLSVVENLELAMAPDKRVFPLLTAKLTGEQKDRITEGLDITGVSELAKVAASKLSHGPKQWLEIGMLLMQT